MNPACRRSSSALPCDTTGQLAPATSGYKGTSMSACGPNGALYAYRTDGYYDGSLTFRGVRTYDSDTQQWSTPDAYQGSADDPMSGLGYNYAGNNPAMFADPSGFCGSAWDDNGPGGAQSTPANYNMSNCPDTAFNNCVIGCYGGGPSAMMIDMLNERLGRLMNNPCVRAALGAGGLTLGVDAIGLVPVLGGFTKAGKIAKGASAAMRVVGHQFGFIGIVADQQGGKLLRGVGGVSGLLLSAPGATQGDKSAMLQGALGLGTFIPGYGDYIAGIQLTLDTKATIEALQNCGAH